MVLEGGCYCGAIRYKAEGDKGFQGQCHCRECQYISGGNSNLVIGMPEDSFQFTQGRPKSYSKADLTDPVTRYFCPDCGTHLTAQAPGANGVTIIKVGTLDDPSIYTAPDMAIWTKDKQDFHHIADGVPAFPAFPGRD